MSVKKLYKFTVRFERLRNMLGRGENQVVPLDRNNFDDVFSDVLRRSQLEGRNLGGDVSSLVLDEDIDQELFVNPPEWAVEEAIDLFHSRVYMYDDLYGENWGAVLDMAENFVVAMLMEALVEYNQNRRKTRRKLINPLQYFKRFSGSGGEE